MKTLVIVVNYKSADLTLRAVQSVIDSQSLGPVETVVVDNSEDEEEAQKLRRGLPPSVHLLVSPENIGFGRACNMAFDRYPADTILLLNPDARILPGCLHRLQSTLCSATNAAAISPHIFWDPGCRFLLPSSYPRALLEVQAIFDCWHPQAVIHRLLGAIWRFHSIRVWCAKRPVRVTNLSGSLVLLKATALLKAGGLFDPRFFLYFEDTDLFVRLRQAGYVLLVDPGGKAIHHYDQCGRNDLDRKRSLMMASHEVFLKKHGEDRICRLIRQGTSRLNLSGGGQQQPSFPDFTAPFTVKTPNHLCDGWLFEWSPFPTLLPSVAYFGHGPLMEFPRECWEMLAPGRYFGRFGKVTPFGRDSRVISWSVNGSTQQCDSNENDRNNG